MPHPNRRVRPGIQLHTHLCNMEIFFRIRNCFFGCGSLRGGAIAFIFFNLVQHKFYKIHSFILFQSYGKSTASIKAISPHIYKYHIYFKLFISPLQASCDK